MEGHSAIDTGSGPSGDRTHIPPSFIPDSLLGRLERAVHRKWLLERVEAFLTRPAPRPVPRITLIVGEPGSGKTILAGQMAEAWRCPCYFVRLGSADGVAWKDPRSFLTALGLQLRICYGAEIFGPSELEVHTRIDVGRVVSGGQVKGVEVGKVSLSPFQRAIIEVDITTDELAGEALGVRVGEMRDTTDRMSISRLALEALVKPLQRLATERPSEQVRIIVDALDESPDVAQSLPPGDELPGNAALVVTSRPGDHLNRFLAASGAADIKSINLSSREFASYSVADAEHYVLKYLTDPPMATLVAAAPPLTRPIEDLARDIAEMSQGNFLYLYHLLEGLRQEMQQGRFDLWAAPSDALPRGLDGIYRYFVTERLRARGKAKRGARTWAKRYVPVLGVLAVARAPLTSSQLAAFSGVDRLYVDDILGEVGMFIETVDLPDDTGHQIFHSSFADFLLTQDHVRNRYPLESAAHYHRRIADYYLRSNDQNWDTCEDRYALIHLPTHLRDAEQIEQLCTLLRGPFGQRQMIIAGSAQVHTDVVMAAREAAMKDRDEDFLKMLERGAGLERDMANEWESGRYVLALLVEEVTLVRERAQGGSSQMLPWTNFLVAERLLDLGAVSEAHDVLRSLVRRPWPAYQPYQLDFGKQKTITAFLAQVAQSDSLLALALTKRLFRDRSGHFPNVRSAWADVMEAFLALPSNIGEIPGFQVTAEQYKTLVDTTCRWLRETNYTSGLENITRGIFPLLARSLPAINDPIWLAEAIQTSISCRLGTAKKSQEPSIQNDQLAAWSDLFRGIVDIWEALLPWESMKIAKTTGSGVETTVLDSLGVTGDAAPPDILDSYAISNGLQLRMVLENTWRQITSDLPAMAFPLQGSYSHRAASLCHLAHTLYCAGAQQWSQYAEAGLVACDLDGAMLDATVSSVAEGLMWLRHLPDSDFALRAEALIVKLNLVDLVARTEYKELGERIPQNVPTSVTEGLDRLLQAPDAYERGRLTLQIWKQRDRSVREEIEIRLAKAYEMHHRAEPLPVLSDILVEAMLDAVMNSSASWALEVIPQLEHCRTSERRKEVSIDVSSLLSASRYVRWHALEHACHLDVLRAEVEVEYLTASKSKNVASRRACCLAAISFDPELAYRWYLSLRPGLKNRAVRGPMVTLLLEQLGEWHAERLNDLGKRWSSDLPGPDPSEGIEAYQLLICKRWGNIATSFFRTQVITQLLYIAHVLPSEIERLLSEIKRPELSKDRHTRKRQGKLRKETEDVWYWVGEVLGAVSSISIQDHESGEALQEVVVVLEKVWKDKSKYMRDQEKNASIESLLDGFVSTINDRTLVPTPIAKLMVDLFRLMIDASKVDVLERVHRLSLGLKLAALLKRAVPEFWENYVQRISAIWDKLLIRELSYGLAELFDFFDRTSRSIHEDVLFQLTEGLVNWHLAYPSAPQNMKNLQSRLGQVDNVNLRVLLLALVARGWLQSDDFKHALSLAQVADSKSLADAGFYEKLRTVVRRNIASLTPTEFGILKSLVIDVLLITPLQGSGHALHDALVIWLSLRAQEQARMTKSAKIEDFEQRYLRQMVDWTISIAMKDL